MGGSGLSWIMEFSWWWIDMDHGLLMVVDLLGSRSMSGSGLTQIMEYEWWWIDMDHGV